MAAESCRHNRVEPGLSRALEDTVERTGAHATVYADGMAVRSDASTVREPDAFVVRGRDVDPEAVEAPPPLVACGVVSPSSRSGDLTRELVGSMSVPSIARCVVVDPDRRTVVHHARDGTMERGIRGAEDTFLLDPLGIAVPVASFPDRR